MDPRTGTEARRRLIATLALFLLLATPSHARPQDLDTADATRLLDALPLTYLPNHGQWPAQVAARVQAAGSTCWLEPGGLMLGTVAPRGGPAAARDRVAPDSRGAAVRLAFVGADRNVVPRGEVRLPGVHSFLRGNDRSAWATGLTAYGRMRYAALYPGVDLLLRGNDGRIEYDLVLEPGADLDDVIVRVEGGRGLTLDGKGALVIDTPVGLLRQPAPRTWERRSDGRRVPLDCRFVVLDADHFGFAAPDRDPGARLVVDPVLEWSTFLGGGSSDMALAASVDEAGRLVIAGTTSPVSYPVTPGAFDVSGNGARDAFVTRLTADGSTLVSSTLLGGNGNEEILAVGAAPDGGLVVAGWTASDDFPTSAGAYDVAFAGGSGALLSDGFVTCLDESGSALVLSTYLGGAADDGVHALAVGPGGRIYAAGKTSSPDFPAMPGAFDTTFGGGTAEVGDAFVVCVASDGGELPFATYLGGGGDDLINALLARADGSVTVAGWTASPDFPVTSDAAQPVLNGWSDAFVATLSPDGAALTEATFLGGSGDENAFALALDDSGRLLATGTTRSVDFPVTDGTSYGGGAFFGDTWVAGFADGVGAIDFATQLGGSGDDVPAALVALSDGALLVAGWSGSADLPVTAGAPDTTLGGGADAYLAHLDPAAAAPLFLTYLGGASTDRAAAVLALSDGTVVLAGHTDSSDFPITPGAYDEQFDGFPGIVSDATVSALDIGLAGVPSLDWVDLGFALPGSAGVPQLTATGSLAPGGGGGSLQLAGALPDAPAVLLVGVTAGYVPLRGGVLVPWPLLAVVDFTLGPSGSVSLPYPPAPAGTAGAALVVQAWVLDPGTASGAAASNGLSGLVP